MKFIHIIFYPLIVLINWWRFLTILPLPNVPYYPLKKIAFALPIASVAIGFITAFFYQIGFWMNLPPFICGLFVIIGQVILTGALHEDGLADSADALGVRSPDKHQKLQKTRDGHAIGTYGTLALILVLLSKAMLFTAIINPKMLWLILPLAHMLSRTQWVVLVTILPLVEGSKLAPQIMPIARWQLVIVLLLSFIFSFALFEYFLFFSINWELILLFWLLQIYGFYYFFKRKFGGLSGDLLGAAQQITECLIIFVALCMIFLAK
ncbi:MAG: adenosylcobinamide-GDP ribazoletransferase [Alphaproteobacteria bacterium]|nr:adenosylcobinamide-GDP ribazoletransferase [Alphaproteobacteria bacterium]